ncbi:MAG: hypothetical protein IPK83_12655 [Planctomycetes bacterium]|nr:hypothetical protein [Planctomycetota bacterium]
MAKSNSTKAEDDSGTKVTAKSGQKSGDKEAGHGPISAIKEGAKGLFGGLLGSGKPAAAEANKSESDETDAGSDASSDDEEGSNDEEEATDDDDDDSKAEDDDDADADDSSDDDDDSDDGDDGDSDDEDDSEPSDDDE